MNGEMKGAIVKSRRECRLFTEGKLTEIGDRLFDTLCTRCVVRNPVYDRCMHDAYTDENVSL